MQRKFGLIQFSSHYSSVMDGWCASRTLDLSQKLISKSTLRTRRDSSLPWSFILRYARNSIQLCFVQELLLPNWLCTNFLFPSFTFLVTCSPFFGQKIKSARRALRHNDVAAIQEARSRGVPLRSCLY